MYAIRSYYADVICAALFRGVAGAVGRKGDGHDRVRGLHAAAVERVLQVAEDPVRVSGQLRVITSYSIHYTKLYEPDLPY